MHPRKQALPIIRWPSKNLESLDRIPKIGDGRKFAQRCSLWPDELEAMQVKGSHWVLGKRSSCSRQAGYPGAASPVAPVVAEGKAWREKTHPRRGILCQKTRRCSRY